MRIGIVLAVLAAPLVLRPGAPDIASGHLQNQIRTVRLVVGDSEITRQHYELRVVPPDDLLLVLSARSQSRSLLDSTMVRRRGLVPVWEVAQYETVTKRITYDGSRLTILQTTPDSGTKRIERRSDGASFSFAELNDLIRSLPLRQGYERILPLYSEGSDAFEMDTVRVESRAADGQWTLRFADPDIIMTYGIDERTRRIVRQEYTLRRDGKLRRFLD